jgi:hypothetical protein
LDRSFDLPSARAEGEGRVLSERAHRDAEFEEVLASTWLHNGDIGLSAKLEIHGEDGLEGTASDEENLYLFGVGHGDVFEDLWFVGGEDQGVIWVIAGTKMVRTSCLLHL